MDKSGAKGDVQMVERIVVGMLRGCTNYVRTQRHIAACERERDAALDARGRAVLDGVLVRLRERLATFPKPDERERGP